MYLNALKTEITKLAKGRIKNFSAEAIKDSQDLIDTSKTDL